MLSCSLLAQSKTTASLRGVAEDASHARVIQARVALSNNATNARSETVSSPDGDCLLPFVTPGTYMVEVTIEEFATWKRSRLELTVGQEATLDIHLDVSSAQLEIDVTAEVPLIESQRTHQSNTLNQDSVRNLPIDRRDYLTFSLLAPGIRDWGPFASNPTGAAFFVNPLVFQENLYKSNANSDYHGLMLEATHRMSRRTTLHFNYTFAKAIDETTDFNSDFQPNHQTNRRAERALSSFDQRHKAVAYAVLQTPENANRFWADTLFTPSFRYSSARPFNLLAGTELNNDRHNTTDRPYFAGRNTGIGPSFAAFDMRVSRRFSTGEN